MKKRIAILGSTGSIGTQALEVIKSFPDDFCAEVITANTNDTLLIEQALKFSPDSVVIADESKYLTVKEALHNTQTKVYAGYDALSQVVELDNVDMVLTAMVGSAGLKPTLKAIESGKQIALANKETLVVAGSIVTKLASEKNVAIIPVDSEHSAIYQCLGGEHRNRIEKIYLTASGGPFRGMKKEQLKKVTQRDALKHPNWKMGDKITIDSASLMNKGLEVIEAHWLFGLKAEQIEVIVHPQSIIHSMVQFEDGSIKAQLGLPDMKLPIQYAFGFPYRMKSSMERFDFVSHPQFTFEKADTQNFRNLALAYIAFEQGGNIPCAMNAANEIVVKAFLNEKISFLQMPDLIERCMNEITFVKDPVLEDLINTDIEARNLTLSYIN